MISKLTFVTGLAVGYVLGAKAGRDRYEQIQKLMGSSPVQHAGATAAGLGREAGAKAVHALGDHIPERVGRHLPDRFGRFGANGSPVTPPRYGQGL
ncbi:YtxH domain-containing protein [Streptomyces sp. SID3343]|uniref:YtxH domain-containing protein n=1 Tax=Streptomyces sp. SID3343 TaxID=2690260 RepID=UPI001367A04E|nr:YtxH domain-containing protein [Streptomyces sp. SID3343]MYW04192.1 YtxH domain-containing protein [Streptomyces sp. SID3343]